MSNPGQCAHCRQFVDRVAEYRGGFGARAELLCDSCEIEAEREAAAAHEAEYEDARWDLAHDYGYDAP